MKEKTGGCWKRVKQETEVEGWALISWGEKRKYPAPFYTVMSVNLEFLLNWPLHLTVSQRCNLVFFFFSLSLSLSLSQLLSTVLFSSSISFSHVCRCRIGTHWLSVSPPILRNYALAAMLPAESLLGLSGVLGCNPSLIIRYKFKSSHG